MENLWSMGRGRDQIKFWPIQVLTNAYDCTPNITKSKTLLLLAREIFLLINPSLSFFSFRKPTKNMEKLQHPKLEKLQVPTQINHLHQEAMKPVVWDCGSSLYDSFELNSFKRQLDSALVSRSLSMSHLPDHRAPLQPPPPPPKKPSSSSKISRSLQKLLKSVFKSKQSSSAMLKIRQRSSDEYSVYYDKTGALTTIPEVPEIDFGGLSPEINSLARRKGASERFTATSNIAISCA